MNSVRSFNFDCTDVNSQVCTLRSNSGSFAALAAIRAAILERLVRLARERWGSERAVRFIMMAVIIVFTSTLSACGGTLRQFDPKAAAQSNYEKALAEYQNCYATNKSVDACDKERQMMDAAVKVLATALASGG